MLTALGLTSKRQNLFAKVGTQACPNYDWLHVGYDGIMNSDESPIRTGCVYYASTRTGHLAWTYLMPKRSYFLASPSLHCFLFFVPYLVMFKRPFLQYAAAIFLVTGPVFTAYLTPSLQERPSVWCVFSVVQVAAYIVAVRIKGVHKPDPPTQIHHEGGRGEEPLTYVLEGTEGDGTCARIVDDKNGKEIELEAADILVDEAEPFVPKRRVPRQNDLRQDIL